MRASLIKVMALLNQRDGGKSSAATYNVMGMTCIHR